jgi:hypothetical protein
MLKNLGPLGIAGVAVLLAGLGLIAYADLVVAAGLALVLLGLGLVIKALVSGVLRQFGMM